MAKLAKRTNVFACGYICAHNSSFHERSIHHTAPLVFQCFYDVRVVWPPEISAPAIFSKNRSVGAYSGQLGHCIYGILPHGARQPDRFPGKRRAFYLVAIESDPGGYHAGGIHRFHPCFVQKRSVEMESLRGFCLSGVGGLFY